MTELSLQAHVRARQIELAKSLESRKAVYLDIKFWIILRDVVLGLRDAAPEKELLRLLRRGTQRNLIFCPVSDSIFGELLKKVEVKCRQVAADLIDELSLGVSLIPYDMRASTELAHFLHAARTPDAVHPLKHLVWTKLAYVLGFIHPTNTAVSPQQELDLQKMFFEHMWTISMREMVNRLGNHELPDPQRFDRLASKLNELNARHADDLRDFARTYENEVHGVLDAFEDVSVDIADQMVRVEYGEMHSLPPKHRKKEGRQVHNLLFAAFKQEETKTALRTLHILAILHAKVRWNRQQRLKTNDFLDFQHATAALGYCDAFFTERPLRAMVTANQVALDQRFDCHVGASAEEAIIYLMGLGCDSDKVEVEDAPSG